MSDSPLFDPLEPRLLLSSASTETTDDPPSARPTPRAAQDAPVQRSIHSRSRDIFGRDDRTRVRNTTKHPYAAVGQIESWWDDGSGLACSGALISRYHVLTAAHCVYDDRDGRADDIDFTPARDGDEIPFGTISGAKFRIDANYRQTQSFADDYAVITLTEPIGDETGWFGYGSYKTSAFSRMPVRSTGYPGDRDEGDTMYTQRGQVSFATADRLMTNLDVAVGQSGSPIYRAGNTIVGVLSSSNSQYTYATRLTTQRFRRFERWIAKDERKLAARAAARVANPTPFSVQPVTTTKLVTDRLWNDREETLA